MELASAHAMLGTDAATPLAERQAAYQRQKTALENHLAQATLPVLRDHFKRALTLLDEAYAEIEIAAASGDLPVLRALGHVAHAPESAATPVNGHGAHAEPNTANVPLHAESEVEAPLALSASGARQTIGGARIIDEDTFDLAPEQRDRDNIDLTNPDHDTDRTNRTVRPLIGDVPAGDEDTGRPATRRLAATSPANNRPATQRVIAPAPVNAPRPGTNRVHGPGPVDPASERITAPAIDEAVGNPGTRTVHRALVDALLARADATQDPKLRHALLSEACNAALVAADSPKTPPTGQTAAEGKPGSSRVPRSLGPVAQPDGAAALERLRSTDPEIAAALISARSAIDRASQQTGPIPTFRDEAEARAVLDRAGMPTVDMKAVTDDDVAIAGQSERAGMPTMPMPALRPDGTAKPRPTHLQIAGEPGLAQQMVDARAAARRSLQSTVPMPAITADMVDPDEEQMAVAIAPGHPDHPADAPSTKPGSGKVVKPPTGNLTRDDVIAAAKARAAKTEIKLAIAGFWARLGANILDTGLVLAVLTVLAFCAVHSRHATNIVAFALPVFALVYFLYLGWRFDGTPGKLVMGLRLRTPAGRQIGILAGFLRAVPELTLSVVLALGLMQSAAAIPQEDWLRFDVFERWSALGGYLPDWFTPESFILALWILSEPLVLLTNRKHLALQDLLAETVVVQEELDPISAARLAMAAKA